MQSQACLNYAECSQPSQREKGLWESGGALFGKRDRVIRKNLIIRTKINTMNIVKTEIEGVLIIEPRLFRDARGYFFESFCEREFEEKATISDE